MPQLGGEAEGTPCPIIRSRAFLATASKASDFGIHGATIIFGSAGLGFGGGGRGVGLQTSRFTELGVATASCGATVKESCVKLLL